MGAFEDQQRKNVQSGLASGRITKAQADSALSKIGGGSSGSGSTSTAKSSLNSTYNSGSKKINTSGLSGYAKSYAEGINGGGSDQQSHQYANAVNKGSGLTQDFISRINSIPGYSMGTGVNGAGYASSKYDKNNPYTQIQGLVNEYLPGQTMSFDINSILNQIMGRMPTLDEDTGSVLSYGQAQKQAKDMYDPMYGDLMDKTLKAVDQNNIRRGFFGQLPGAALSRSTAANIESQKNQAVGNLSNQLVNQSVSNVNQAKALAQQQFSTQANALLSALNAALNVSNAGNTNNMNMLNYLQGIKQQDEDNAYRMLPWLTNI